MIRREHFCNKLNELGYTFKRQADRVLFYRKRGSTHFVTVPRKDFLSYDYVRSTLRQCGCETEEIEYFVANHNNH